MMKHSSARTFVLQASVAVVILAISALCSHSQEVVAPPSAAARTLLEQEARAGMRLGMFDLFPRVSALALYDDNIFVNSVVKESDFIWSIAPGATLTLGEPGEANLALSYTPNILFFTDHSEFDTVDHSASLAGSLPFSKLTLGFSQSFSQASSVVLGVADRVEHRSYNTGLNSRYEFSEKTSFEINGRMAITDYEDNRYINTREWANDDWLNYQVLPKLSIGPGLTIGYLDVDRYPDQFYQRVAARALYNVTGKVDLNASVGGERREYSGTSSARYYPVFSIGALYRPTALLTISLNGFRQEQSSAYLADQNYVSTGFSATAQHLLLERFVASLSGSYHNLEYHQTFGSFSATRSDDVFSVRPGFDWLISRSWRAGVFYLYRKNTSDQTYYDYSNNQVGMHASWAF